MALEDTKTINSLQVLRGLAALAVTAGHTFAFTDNAGLVAFFDDFVLPYTFGVDAFFVISGFIMYYTSREKFGAPGYPLNFFRKRLARIAPMYWLCTLVIGTIYLAFGQLDGDIVKSLLFIPYYAPDGHIYPVLGVGWTLNYEMLFYFIFGLSLFFRPKLAIAFVTTTISVLVISGYLIGSDNAATWAWTRPIILEFLFGVFIGIAYHKWGKTGNIWLALMLLALSMAVVPLTGYGIIPTIAFYDPRALQAVLLVFACASLIPWSWESRTPAFLIYLGNISYALYLVHPIVVRALKAVLKFDMPNSDLLGAIFIMLGITASIVAAHFMHNYFEKPVTAWLSGTRKRPIVQPT